VEVQWTVAGGWELLRGGRFYFTPLTGGLFIIHSRYYSLPVAKEYLALGGGPPEFTPGSTRLALLGKSPEGVRSFAYGPITLYGRTFQISSARPTLCNLFPALQDGMVLPRPRHYNACRLDIVPVWAISVSLAATQEVEVSFFSWGYLDVSVHPVPH